MGEEIKIFMDCFGEEMEFQHHTIHKNLKCQGLNAIALQGQTGQKQNTVHLS